MTTPNSHKPIKSVSSIKKCFEEASENQQFQQQLSFTGSDTVKNIRLQFEEKISRKNRYSNFGDNNYFNGNEKASSRTYTSNSFENESGFNAGGNAYDSCNNEAGNVLAKAYDQEINNLKSTTALTREYTNNALPVTRFSLENATINSEPFTDPCCDYNSDNADNAKSDNISVHEDDYIQQNYNKKKSFSSDSSSLNELCKKSKSTIPNSDFSKISVEKHAHSNSNKNSKNINIAEDSIDSKETTLCPSKLGKIHQAMSSKALIQGLKKGNEHKEKSESHQLIYTPSNTDKNIHFTINNSLKQKNENALYNLRKHTVLDVEKDDCYTIGNALSSFNHKETTDNLSEKILDKSKHTISAFAGKCEESFDATDDIYGTHSNVGTDFCVETFNNNNQNLLFKKNHDLTEYDVFNTVLESNLFSKDKYDNHKKKLERRKSKKWSINNTNQAEAELKSTDNICKDSNILITKTSAEYHEFQNSDCTDGSGPYINLNYFSYSVEQYNVVKELIDTEETYLKNILYVIVNYLQHFRRDPYISPDIEIVFGNIEQIYRETKKILASMKSCTSAEEIANVFLNSVHIFELYIEYMTNKSKWYQYATTAFSKLLKNRQTELNDAHSCEHYLVNPVQRLARYGLLLRKLREVLLKTKQPCTVVDKAIALIETKTFDGNTIMAINSIRYCPMNLKNLKRYLMTDTFYINRKRHNALFLFEEGVVFCKEDKNNVEQYEFLECLEMDKLVLKDSVKSTNFYLGYYNKSKKHGEENKYEFDIEARSVAVKEEWVKEIQRLLWGQLQSVKDRQNAKRLSKASLEEFEENDLCEGSPLSEEDNEYGEMNNKFDIEYIKASSIKNERLKIDIMHTFSEAKSFNIYNISEGQKNRVKVIISSEKHSLTVMQDIINNNGVDTEDENFCPYIYILIENIKSIYRQGITIYSKLLECHTIDAFAKVYLDNASIFDLYINYMINKSTFYRYTILKRIELDSHETFDDYLVNAVVRLRRYKTQLEALDKELRKTGDLCPTLKVLTTLVYDKMITLKRILVIHSIQRCPVNLEKMGSFTMKEDFHCKSSGEVMIFLFDRIIILTRKDSNNSDTYIYIDSIELAVLAITSTGVRSLKLKSQEKLKTMKKRYEIEAKSAEKKEIWMNMIENLLKGF